MSRSDHSAGAFTDAVSLEWPFSFLTNCSPWTAEQSMTQLLAYEDGDGFRLPLADAVQADGKAITSFGRRRTPQAVAALRAYQAMSTIDT